MTNEAGQVVAGYEYDPYGNPIGEQESGYGYTGEFWQSELGLLHLRARWYDPSTGTFLSKDPWPGSTNPYSYVNGNPTNRIDPLGWYSCDPISGECEDGRYLCVIEGKYKGSYVNGQPCIVNPNNVQTGNAPTPSLPPAIHPTTLADMPVRPPSPECECSTSSPLSDCEMFVREVEQIIQQGRNNGLSDRRIVQILAEYYSGFALESQLPSSDSTYSLPSYGNRPHQRDNNERWGVNKNGCASAYQLDKYHSDYNPNNSVEAESSALAYGFKRPFYKNTHHYFAMFYVGFFYPIPYDGIIPEMWEQTTGATIGDNRLDTQSDYWVNHIAVKHANEIRGRIPYWGDSSRLSLLPTLLRQDICGKTKEEIYERWDGIVSKNHSLNPFSD